MDITQAQALLEGFAPRHVLADKGYDSRALVDAIQAQEAEAVIPPRSCQQPRASDKNKYRLRNRIERCFARLKQWRRVAMRHDRKPANFLCGILLASIFIWLNVDSASGIGKTQNALVEAVALDVANPVRVPETPHAQPASPGPAVGATLLALRR